MTARVLCLALGATTLVACANPESAYESFQQRYASDLAASSSSSASTTTTTTGSGGGGGGAGGGSSCPPAPATISVDYYMVMSSNLSPPKPLVFKVSIDAVQQGKGLSTTLTVQALDASDRKTSNGDKPFVLKNQLIAADGSFTDDFGSITVSGNANPISGTDISATGVELKGSFCDPTFVCGTVSGMLTKPLMHDLSAAPGSNFTMQPFPDLNTPPPAYIDCNKTLAAALP